MAGGGGDDAWANATGTSIAERTQSLAEEAAINEAVQQLRDAVGAAVVQVRPAVIQNATAILEKALQAEALRDEIIESLQDIFPDLDPGPWKQLGTEAYFNGRSADFETLRVNTQPIKTDGSRGDGDRYWAETASSKYLERLSQTTLQNPEVQKHLWQASGSPPNNNSIAGAGPWGTGWIKGTDHRWCWVSTLDTTFRNSIPDFGSYDTAFFRAAGGDSSAVGSGTETTGVEVFNGYPHGWLTTLETVIAMLGYYVQSASEKEQHSTLGGPSLRTSATNYFKPYSMFTENDIEHLNRGDIDVGWNSIMDANHSNNNSWTKAGKLPYNRNEPITGENTPDNFLQRSFSQGENGECHNGGQWRANEGVTSIAGGRSHMHRFLRPYSMLFSGGPLAQGLTNSWNVWSQENEDTGANYSEKIGNVKRRWLARLSDKLSADGARFMAMASPDDNTAAVLAAIINRTNDNAAAQTSVSADAVASTLETVRSNSEIYTMLGRLLTSLASSVNTGLLDQLHAAHGAIQRSHRIVIEKTCDAIEEAIDFDSGDTLQILGFGADDDWDDDLGDDVLANMGDPLANLNAAAIGAGVSTSVMFKEQCFLLSFISDLAAHKRLALDRGTDTRPSTKRIPYHSDSANKDQTQNNASILIDGESYGFLNKLTQNPRLGRFYNALNHELSNLQPKIRLWKVIFDDQGNEQEIEIKFESHFSAADLQMFRGSVARGVGAGLKSFNFTYDGSNPFSVKKSIKANLKIFANTMSEILRDRPSSYVDDQGVVRATTYKYSDLAMKTWNTAEVNAETAPATCAPDFDLREQNAEKAELNFRLKAEVGFSQPMNKMSSMSEDLREALSEAFVTLNLTPTVHNFEIDDMGRVVFNMNFLAYIEQFFDQSMFNVFTSGPITLQQMYRKEILRYYNTQACDAEQIGQKKEEFSTQVKTEQEEAIASLLGDMISADLIYYLTIPYEKISSFLSFGPHNSYDDFLGADSSFNVLSNASHNAHMQQRVESALGHAFGDETENLGDRETTQGEMQAALLGNDPREHDLSFFYLSDLIDLVLMKIESGLKQAVDDIQFISRQPDGALIPCERIASNKKDLVTAQKNLKKVRIALGPVEFSHASPRDGKRSIFVNLGDVPISVKYFIEWLTSKMLQKDQTSYSLTKFVNDLINNLLSNFLNNDQCFGYSVKQKTRLNQSAISSWSPSTEHDSVSKRMIEVLQTDGASTGIKNFRTHLDAFEGQMPVLNPSGPSNSARTSMPFQNQYNFFVYFAGRVMPSELMRGNKFDDENNFGIFHYMLGRDRGLVKNIKLTKTQTKGLAEVRFESQGFDGLEQLRVTYDAQVDMFASVNTFPGTYIYIDPRGFAPEGSGTDEFRLTDLGIGGYYMIVRSEHEFAEGKANTTLHTKWVNQIDRDEEDAQAQSVTDLGGSAGDPISRRCSIQVREPSTPEPPETNIPWIPFF